MNTFPHVWGRLLRAATTSPRFWSMGEGEAAARSTHIAGSATVCLSFRGSVVDVVVCIFYAEDTEDANAIQYRSIKACWFRDWVTFDRIR